MPEQVRAEYEKAPDGRREMLWDANERAFKEAEKRKQQKLRAEGELTAKALDMLQRIREDPSKAHHLPPPDASMADLHKWYEEKSRPIRNLPFPSEGGHSTADQGKSVPGIRSGPKPTYPHGRPPARMPSVRDGSALVPPAHTNTSDFFKPNRGWFLGGAGLVGAYIIDQIQAPLWLALTTLFVLLASALIWPWIDKSKRRRGWFWFLLILYSLFVVGTAYAYSSPSPIAMVSTHTPSVTVGPTTDERKLLDVKPEYLADFFKKYNDAQAQKLIETYIGKWVKLSGEVIDVSNYKSGRPNATVTIRNTKTTETHFGVIAEIEDQRWVNRALVLRRDESITVFGKITKITALNPDYVTFWLDKCEIVE